MDIKKISTLSIVVLLFLPGILRAYTSTSTNFFIRQNVQSISGGTSVYSQSTSTSFLEMGAGGQSGVGISTSTSFINFSGVLQNLLKSPKPEYVQVHYHFRNDDGSESAATSKTSGLEDTTVSAVSKSTPMRLRMEIANKGGTSVSYFQQQFRIEYGLKVTTCSSVASWIDVGTVAGDWDMANSSFLTDGNNTTNIAISSGGVSDENNIFFGGGTVKDTGSQTLGITASSLLFTELEYSLQALSAATDGGTYCFRVTNAGSSSLFTYSVYPEATLATGTQTLTFSISDSSVGLSTLSPSGDFFATGDGNGSATEVEAHTIIASTNATNGYTLTINGSTLTCSACGGATISAIGSSNTASSPGTEQFGLRMTASGGSGTVSVPYAASGFAFDTAAFPDGVAVDSDGDNVATTYSVRYIGNISPTTEAGSYSSVLTYSITGTF